MGTKYLLWFVTYALICVGVIGVTAVLSPNSIVVVTLLALAFFGFAMWSAYKDIARQQEINRSARGRKMETHQSADKEVRRLRPEGDPGVLWGKVRIPSSNAKWHFCVVGAVGSGKTLTIRTLMKDQLPRIQKGSDTRAMIYDAKQDMVRIVKSLNLNCPVIILNPFDKRSTGWHMAKDIDSPAAARQLAATLVPSDEKESQPFFSNAVRELLAAVVTVFVAKQPGEWTFRDVLLVMQSKDLIRQVLASDSRTQATMKNFLDCGEVTVGSIMATVATKLGPFEAIAAAWEESEKKISITRWLKSSSILILGNDERVRASLDTVNQLFVAITAQHVLSMSESRTRTTWFIFDEFSEAGRLHGLESIILRGRSKGCCVVLGFQDIQHVNLVYKDNLGNTLVGQCGNKAFLRIESPETAEWASKCIGDVERIEIQVAKTDSRQGGSTSETFQRQTRAQVMPSQFMELPLPENGLTGYYIIRSAGCYSATYSPPEIDACVGRPDERIPAFDAAPVEWQYLSPWTSKDAERLGLFTSSEAASTVHADGNDHVAGKSEEAGDGLADIGRIDLGL